MFTQLFAPLVVAIISNVISGIIIALFEEWLDNRSDKQKKK